MAEKQNSHLFKILENVSTISNYNNRKTFEGMASDLKKLSEVCSFAVILLLL